jgi:hypothetical protein
MSKDLLALQGSTLSKLDVENIVVQTWQDELDPHIQLHYDLKQEVNDKFDTLHQSLHATIDTSVKNHPALLQLSNVLSCSLHPQNTWIHQHESKNFSVSKLQKELKEITLHGDYLKDLEIFWGAILRAFTNQCQLNQVYPYYHDLHSSFDFWNHLVGDPTKTKLSTKDDQQVQCIYHSFGDALRHFLHTSATISTTTCPKSYLKLISFCDVCDAFRFLLHLIFSLSPQLSGDCHDFFIDISKLTILPDKHISTFYKRVIELSTEILLANISYGAFAELGYQFIYLLCSTNCPTIIGILVPYWKAITKHCWDPNHLSLPLPWAFKEIYDNLISCNINVLPSPMSSDLPPTDPIVARGSSATFTSPGSNRPTSSKHTTIYNYWNSSYKGWSLFYFLSFDFLFSILKAT